MTISSNFAANGPGLHCHGLVRLSGLGGLIQAVGRHKTDLYLEEFEQRLNDVIRPVDKLTRVAEDKYCLVLQDVKDRNLVELAVAKLERTLGVPAEIDGERLFFKINGGFAVPGVQLDSNESLLQTAESGLHFAISSNQSTVVFESGELKTPPFDPSLLPRIEAALERSEFVLHYQPKVDAADRNVVGAEGLVRWYDTDRQQVIMPGAFIEVAERSSLIKPLTDILIRGGIARCVTWPDPLSLAINVPPSILESPDVVAVVADALDFYGLAAHRLVLEITERGELPRQALVQLDALREVGVKISIDDFGTGQCSLTYFRDLPADEVKIDLSFVQAMRTSHKDKCIVRGCIDLAHHCDMRVIAEGVEDEETALELAELGCDLLQGYWLGRPIDGDEFEQVHIPHLQGVANEGDLFSHLLH